MVPVSIKGCQYIVLLDFGSQINVLKSSIWDDLNVPLRYDERHVVIGAGHQNTRLDGICEATPVALASMTESLHSLLPTSVLTSIPILNLSLQPDVGTHFGTRPSLSYLSFYLIFLSSSSSFRHDLRGLHPHGPPSSSSESDRNTAFEPTHKLTAERVNKLNFGPTDFINT
ncbi:hypothetical protein CF327_g6839 [Tilletia walkeri]|nr:hypothetical protein CF327_g6839 [Tilletia walkeri]